MLREDISHKRLAQLLADTKLVPSPIPVPGQKLLAQQKQKENFGSNYLIFIAIEFDLGTILSFCAIFR